MKKEKDCFDINNWVRCATREFNKIKKIYNINSLEQWERFKVFLENFEENYKEYNKNNERKVSPEVFMFMALEIQQTLEFVELIEGLYKKVGKKLF